MAKSKSYHKENLRQDLVDAGRAYVETHGHQSLSVRTLAQKVGVSAGAPYHHFGDRRLLLLAIAADGFRILTQGATEIGASGLSGRDKLIALGLHFIEFADKSPRLFELMYESELATPRPPLELRKYQKMGQELIRPPLHRDCEGHRLAASRYAPWPSGPLSTALRRCGASTISTPSTASGCPGRRWRAPS